MKNYLLTLMLVLATANWISAQKPREKLLFNFGGEGSKDSQGTPAFAYKGDDIYVLYTDEANNMGMIYHYNIKTKSEERTHSLFPTIGADDAGHNDHAIAIDGDGYIHVWIGMHNHKMKYYRSKKPGDFKNFDSLGHTFPGYELTGIEEKRYSYPTAVSTTNGDVVVMLRRTSLQRHEGSIREIQTGEKQDLYHWNNKTKTWKFIHLYGKPDSDGSTDVNAYFSFLHADDKNNVHIVTAWSQRHAGDNTFQKGSYLKYNVSEQKFYFANGEEYTNYPEVGRDFLWNNKNLMFYYGYKQWNDWGNTISEIGVPRVTVNDEGNPIVAYVYNTNNYSQDHPNWRLDIASWNGNQWQREESLVTGVKGVGIKNAERPLITYNANRVNVLGRWPIPAKNRSRSFLIWSNDNGYDWDKSNDYRLYDDREPGFILNYRPQVNTDIYINYRNAYMVRYKKVKK